MKNTKIYLFFIVLIASALRLVNLSSASLLTDEAKTALGIDFPHSFLLPQISLLSQRIFGVNEFAVRLPFALLGILSVILFYFFIKKFFNEKWAILGAVVFCFLPGNILLSRTAFLDISLVFGWLLVIYFWFSYEEEKSNFNLFLLFLALFITPWLKIQAVYLFMVLGLYILYQHKFKFWQSKRFYILCLSLLPFVFYFLSQPQQLYDMLVYTTKTVGESGMQFSQFGFRLLQNFGFWLVPALLGFVLTIKNFKQTQRKNIDLLMIIFLLFILLVLFVTPHFMYYYVMLDIAIAYFVVKYVMSTDWHKTIFILGITSTLIILYLFSSLSPNFCYSNSSYYDSKCEWSTLQANFNNHIKVQEGANKKFMVFLEERIGFEGKWYVNNPVYKLDFFPLAGEDSLILARMDVKEKLEKQYGKLILFDRVGDFILLQKAK